MLVKFASAVVIGATLQRGSGLVRDAHRHSFDYDPRPGFLYVRSRAISSRTNDNYDHFPAEEIKQAYKTFVGKPVFVNHHNEDHRRARGVVVDAALHEDTNPDGTDDTWVEVLMEVDAVRFPKLAQAILAGEIDRTSMGTDVEYSICSVCSNKAHTPLEYCAHIPKLKGMKVRRATASGTKEEVLVYEKCYGLSFFENSLLVEEPADPTAFFVGVDSRGMEMASGKIVSKVVETTENRGDKVEVFYRPQARKIASHKTAVDEIMAPPEVDTLRDENCPVCGEADSFDGDRCMVCQFIRPPDEFMDPDLEKAKEINLRQEDEQVPVEELGEGEVGEIEGEIAPEDMAEVAPEFQEALAEEAEITEDGDLEAEDDSEIAPEFREDSNGEDSEDSEDDSEDDDTEDDEEDEDDDDDAPPFLKKKKSRRGSVKVRNSGGDMRPALAALADQQKTITRQAAQIKALTAGFRFMAQLAGVDKHPQVVAILKHAEDENPAQPMGWANPGGEGTEAPAATSEETLGEVSNDQPEGGSLPDSVEEVGETSEADVAADATTSVDSTETVLDEPLDLNEQDVTKPVAGTEDLGEGPRGQAGSGRTETEVRVGDPNNPDAAFAETGWTEARKSEGRTFAALRLARLRIQAGIASGDDLALGTKIASSDVSDQTIQAEIETLSQVVKVQGSANGGRKRVSRNLVPRAASGVERVAPSFQEQPVTASVGGGVSDDEFLFD